MAGQLNFGSFKKDFLAELEPGNRYSPKTIKEIFEKAELKDIDIQWWEQEQEIAKKHLDEILANQRKPLSPEYNGDIPQKATPPKAPTLDDIKRIIAEGNQV